MKLIEDREEDSAYTFLQALESEEIDRLIEEYGSDDDLIQHCLSEQYPETKYFVLVDYIDDRNNGYFHIRVWEKDFISWKQKIEG